MIVIIIYRILINLKVKDIREMENVILEFGGELLITDGQYLKIYLIQKVIIL
jgi:hypothetical protein